MGRNNPIPGLTAEVALLLPNGERKLEIGEDGFIGRFDSGAKLVLRITLPVGAPYSAFRTEKGSKELVELQGVFRSPAGCMYRREIAVHRAGVEPFGCTRAPENLIRLIEVQPGGTFRFLEVAVATFEGQAFLVCQDVYGSVHVNRERIRRGREVVMRIRCPRFEGEHGWPELVEVLQALFARRLDVPVALAAKSPVALSLSPRQKRPFERIGRRAGVVRGAVAWFNQASGNGALRLQRGEVLGFNRASLARGGCRDRLPTVEAGEIIEVLSYEASRRGSSLDGWANSVAQLWLAAQLRPGARRPPRLWDAQKSRAEKRKREEAAKEAAVRRVIEEGKRREAKEKDKVRKVTEHHAVAAKAAHDAAEARKKEREERRRKREGRS